MTPKQKDFVRFIVGGCDPVEAYRRASGKSEGASVEAQKWLRTPAIKGAIEKEQGAVVEGVVTAAAWGARASILARLADLREIDAEIERRKQGMALELAGIEADPSISPSDKLRARGEIMQRRVVTRDLLATKAAIYDALDERAPKEIDVCSKAVELLRLSVEQACEGIDPDEYTAPIPPGAAMVKDG